MKKIIKASAGTGKTYRLSLEFVNLLLEYREAGIGFEEILVITFTRKATAEIRESIFSHLDSITDPNVDKVKRDSVLESLVKIFNRTITDQDILYLNKVKQQMLTNKHKLQISTIDSFIHSIFKSVIAPYLGLTDFEVDDNINSRYLPYLYEEILRDEAETETFLQIFSTKGFKTIEQYNGLIESLINNRWLFQQIKEQDLLETSFSAEEELSEYRSVSQTLLSKFDLYLQEDGKSNSTGSDLLKKEYQTLFPNSLSISDFLKRLESGLDDEEFLLKNWQLFSANSTFWNGRICLRKKVFKELADELKELNETAVNQFSKYAFLKLLLPEQRLIIELAEVILKAYDKIKMREKILTYNDISYYTFKYLYDPDLSLIDQQTGEVANRFYEYLSTKTRFILIDEFQDTSVLQFRVLFPIISELLSGIGAKEYGGVIVVGDEKQSIYGWRQGERELLLKMPKIIGSSTSVSLTESYRSTQFIISLINKVFLRLSAAASDAGIEWGYDNEILSRTPEKNGYWNISFYNESSAFEQEETDLKGERYNNFVDSLVLPALRGDNGEAIRLEKTVILARTNKDLESIALALEERGIEYLLESSSPVLVHSSVKPLIYLLRFIAGGEIVPLLEFLRSDYALISAEQLQQVVLLYRKAMSEDISFLQLAEEYSPNLKQLAKVLKLIKVAEECDLVELLSRILEEFSIRDFVTEEQHTKMLHLFLEIAAGFLNNLTLDYPKSLPGFLSYLKDYRSSEEFKQTSLQSSKAIQLMSFHKSKGLQFETVFVFYKKTKGGNRDKKIDLLYQFNENFTELTDYCISYNYSKLLDSPEPFALKEKQETRASQEELNNLYVALTRAKNNLFLFLTYEHKDGIQVYIAENDKNKLNLNKLFCRVLIEYFEQNPMLQTTNAGGQHLIVQSGRTVSEKSDENSKPKEQIDATVTDFINFNRSDYLVTTKEYKSQYEELHRYLQNKQNLIGKITHYYLSFIKYDTVEEREFARKKTISFFGNIATAKEIEEVIKKCDLYIENNRELFAERWTKIFTELTVFNDKGKEYRIDRIMIDQEKRVVLIIDYKTGGINEKNQLEVYREIIGKIPFVKNHNYRIDRQYVNVP